ncbi:MAG: glutamyl-tRNA reductase [Deltaproteobacteria bacterium]|nr:glutamyl-tRNA reductase [Deltaproteobacteria bacterium]
MTISVLSLSYKTAPVEVREKLDIPAAQLGQALEELQCLPSLDEVMVVSTCNRVEVYFAAADPAAAFGAIKGWMAARLEGAGFDFEQSVVRLSGKPALNHLFRVAGSLESMVIGEPQILGQVKEAFQASVEKKCVGSVLMGLMPRVFRTAKRVRTETGISRFAVSISYAAVELAGKIFDSMAQKTVLVIGAGEMAELAIAHLIKTGIGRLMVINRTYDNAVALAEKFQGEPLRYEEMELALASADIVISSTGARGFIITPPMVRQVMRQHKGGAMFFIDIAVPRDIDPDINQITNVYCYDIDDLKSVTDSNRKEREKEALAAQAIVDEEVARYQGWADSLSVVPVIRALREKFNQAAMAEVEKTLPRLSGDSAEDGKLVSQMARTLVNKLLHAPSTHVRQVAEEGDGKLMAEVLAGLFDLTPASLAHPSKKEGPGVEPSGEDVEDEPLESPIVNKVVPFARPAK